MAIGMTRLEAVNTMLSAIGEAPVNTVTDSGLVEVATALQVLGEVNREVQINGWHFNTETDFVLLPEFPSGDIRVPTDTLFIEPCGCDESRKLVLRGGRLYDADRKTFTFPTQVSVKLIRQLPFEDCPEPAKAYITIRAARVFQDRFQGSQEINGFQVADENRAWAQFQNYECRAADLRMTGSWAVNRVLIRTGRGLL